ncbi:5-methyltetrahydrofolate--homocysteine methyltransferase (EC [Olavius sp. associated proteobacterium Delta 1]|nr:5-methyltetrahydrofolate--homocysteine methyltransferase (EC [Olavius sp. associated proteobacterium Delta 1]
MHPLIESLVKDGPAVTDGSWGTQMQKRGLKRGQNPDSWNLTHADQVREVAAHYVDAGSQIILTNTFGASRLSLANFDLADKTVDINMSGVRISKEAASDRACVFASIGPTGKMMITGETTAEELQKVFEEQASAQAEAGADGIIIETMIDIEEARIAAIAAKQTGLPVIVSMVYDSGEDKDHTMMGNSPEEVVAEISKIGVDGIGANCGQGIEAFLPICRRLRQATDLPIWIKPNAGLPEVVDDGVVFRTTPRDFVRYVPDLIQAGANFIGGCCGTDQEFVKAIRQTVEGMSRTE